MLWCWEFTMGSILMVETRQRTSLSWLFSDLPLTTLDMGGIQHYTKTAIYSAAFHECKIVLGFMWWWDSGCLNAWTWTEWWRISTFVSSHFGRNVCYSHSSPFGGKVPVPHTKPDFQIVFVYLVVRVIVCVISSCACSLFWHQSLGILTCAELCRCAVVIHTQYAYWQTRGVPYYAASLWSIYCAMAKFSIRSTCPRNQFVPLPNLQRSLSYTLGHFRRLQPVKYYH